MSMIPLDSLHASERWSETCSRLKAELDRDKVLATQNRETEGEFLLDVHLRQIFSVLRDEAERHRQADALLHGTISSFMSSTAWTLQRLSELEQEKSRLIWAFSRCDAERVALSEQAEVFCSQATMLAAEVDLVRKEKLSRMFKPVSLPDPGFEVHPMRCHAVSSLIDAVVPAELRDMRPMFFLPRPPLCLPLRVPACGQPGYWFYPLFAVDEDCQFELIVEGLPGEWTYLGTYLSALFKEGHMHLSEWLQLDEEGWPKTKCHLMSLSWRSKESTTAVNGAYHATACAASALTTVCTMRYTQLRAPFKTTKASRARANGRAKTRSGLMLVQREAAAKRRGSWNRLRWRRR